MSVSPEPSPEKSVSPGPSFASTSLDQRKRDVRDILSSFEIDVLPSEYQPDIYSRITNEQSTRPISEWTVFANLPATLFNWVVHDYYGWTFVNKWLSTETRAQLFIEKLQRRFEREFDQYDEMVNSMLTAKAHLPSPEPEHMSSVVVQVTRVAEKINSFVAEALLDLDYRSIGQKLTARVMLEAIEKICVRSGDLSSILSTEGIPSSGIEFQFSLYDTVIRGPSTNTPTPVLEALKRASDISPEILQTIMTRFGAPDAPSSYWQRLQELCIQAGVTL